MRDRVVAFLGIAALAAIAAFGPALPAFALNDFGAPAVAPQATPAVASSLVLKASAGELFGFEVTSGASAGYVMVFDAAAAPSDGAVTPIKVYALSAGSTLAVSWGGQPLAFANGLVVVFSITGPFSKTASATAFISGDVQ